MCVCIESGDLLIFITGLILTMLMCKYIEDHRTIMWVLVAI